MPAIQRCRVRLSPVDRLLRRRPQQFRDIFRALLSELGLAAYGFKPYSLRRGGATYHFQVHGCLDSTTLRGRWRDPRTTRIYITTGLADLLSNALPETSTSRITYFKSRCLAAFGQV